MPPEEESAIIVQHELEQAKPWAKRRGLDLIWESSVLRLQTVMVQRETQERFYLQAVFEDYKELPPAWEFFDEDWNASGKKRLYPATSPCPFGSSIFHSTPAICAPFNLLAYDEHGGPHENWSGPANWLDVRGTHVRAERVGGMLQAIHRHLRATRGRMA
jgi:hypothetical protein